MSKTNPIRQLIALSLFLILAIPIYAKEKGDSVFSFRFISGKDNFYVPLIDNGEELARLLDFVGQYKGMIMGHDITLHVNGYCNSKGSEAANLAVAKIRSNRVKSELITRKGITEDCFLTRNHSGQGNFVTVDIFVPKKLIHVDDIPETTEAVKKEDQEENAVTSDNYETEEASDRAEEDESVAEQPVAETPQEMLAVKPAVKKVDRFALKTNLLAYGVLMPNVEFEWMFANRWSAALEVQGAWYAKENPHKVYRLSTVIPEVRYWIIDRSRWHGMYVGAFVGGGLYDLCNGRQGKKGHEGEGGMVGVSAGYMFPISKHLSIDAGIGVGYLGVRDKVYLPYDGHFLYQLTKNINYVGPLRLKLSLAWRF